MIVTGLTLVAAAFASVQNPSSDVVKQFLNSFVEAPAKSKDWFATDAVMVFGDIGGTVDQGLSVLKAETTRLKTCHVSRLEQRPSPGPEELAHAPAQFRDSQFSVFEGSYDCGQKDGTRSQFSFNIVFKDGRVVILAFGEGPWHG